MFVTRFKKNEKVFIKPKGQINKSSKVGKKINKKEEMNEKPEEDISNSKIQNSSKGKYCFIGHQSPHNACVQLNDTTKCMSGKVFKTLKECEGYNQMEWTQKE